ncbi:hypothetical protein EXIGLDRAFT_766114 [Exidia glandulosa HHB12029]|uniref:F-box domain-containing protein n=1 Tax=Exidia glandulosa HHB12029 TaxID=1314781 RepID=A0A165JZ42_EXIGL|nr:hypothetical protein EXIGLDRAFT_766114 [Exidia glandulosa HHB12029]
MRPLPVEFCSEIVQYLDGSSSDLAAVSASTKTFHALATPPLNRHIALRKTASVDRIVRLFHTLGDCAALVQQLELDWTAPSHHGGAVASMMNVRLQRLSGLTYLAVSPALDIFTWAFDDVRTDLPITHYRIKAALVSCKG